MTGDEGGAWWEGSRHGRSTHPLRATRTPRNIFSSISSISSIDGNGSWDQRSHSRSQSRLQPLFRLRILAFHRRVFQQQQSSGAAGSPSGHSAQERLLRGTRESGEIDVEEFLFLDDDGQRRCRSAASAAAQESHSAHDGHQSAC